MEFRFNISKIFKNNISRIGSSLLPSGFVAQDRRTALDTTAYVAEIINTCGQASASAQGLNLPVTTADRLRSSDDQVLYLMTEDDDKNGKVVGLLKVGHKSLYVFDKFGETRHVHAPCVLDFYIHESRQRGGLGKILFEHMLQYENLLPEQMAIDRPSEKLLGFLKKHYGLSEKIPQMNNFVVFDGFFSFQESQKDRSGSSQMHITASPNSNLFGPQFVSDDYKRRSNSRSRQESLTVQSNALGRYGAPKPQCSLNQIIHNKPTSVTSVEPKSFSKETHEMPAINVEEDQSQEEVANDDQNVELEHVVRQTRELSLSPAPAHPSEYEERYGEEDQVDTELSNGRAYHQTDRVSFDSDHHHHPQHLQLQQQYSPQQEYYKNQHIISPTTYNKRQTGKKNISSIVVGYDDKFEFDQTENTGFGAVKINRPIGVKSTRTFENMNDNESVHSRDSEHTHTAEGYFDLKFYSHPLW